MSTCPKRHPLQILVHAHRFQKGRPGTRPAHEITAHGHTGSGAVGPPAHGTTTQGNSVYAHPPRGTAPRHTHEQWRPKQPHPPTSDRDPIQPSVRQTKFSKRREGRAQSYPPCKLRKMPLSCLTQVNTSIQTITKLQKSKFVVMINERFESKLYLTNQIMTEILFNRKDY